MILKHRVQYQDPSLHKAQLLVSLSWLSHNRSILFLMGCQMSGESIRSAQRVLKSREVPTTAAGRVGLGWVILDPPPLCCPFLSASICQRGIQSGDRSASREWTQAPSLNWRKGEENT